MKFSAVFILSLSFLCSGFLHSQEEESKKEEVSLLPPYEVILYLSERHHLDIALFEVGKWSVKNIEAYQIVDRVKSLFASQLTGKKDRLECLDLLSKYSDSKKILSRKDFADFLLGQVEKIHSPHLSEQIIQILIGLEDINDAQTESEISSLITKIILDASETRPVYNPSLHATCLSVIDGRHFSKKVFSALESLLKKLKPSNKHSSILPDIEVAVYRALGNLARSQKKSLSQANKSALLSTMLNILAKKPALLPLQAKENETRTLAALLFPLHHLLSDPSNIFYRAKGVELLSKLLEHPNPVFVEKAGQALLSIKRSELRDNQKETFDLSSLLLKGAKRKASLSTQVLSQAGPALPDIFYSMLQDHLSSILRIKELSFKKQVEEILSFFVDQIQSNREYELRHKSLNALFNLDPSLVLAKNQFLSKKSVETLEKYFDVCMHILEMKSKDADFLEFRGHCISVLYEVTGNNYRQDTHAWKDWKEGRLGKKFFRR